MTISGVFIQIYNDYTFTRLENIIKNDIVIINNKIYKLLMSSNKLPKNNLIIIGNPLFSPIKSEIKNNIVQLSYESCVNFLQSKVKKNIFIIGYDMINKLIDHIEYLYISLYNSNHYIFNNNFKLLDHDNIIINNNKFLTYKKSKILHEEYQYLNLLKELKDLKNIRQDRTNVGTYSKFGHTLTFNISESIPLLTTKFLPIKMILKELIFFISGKTDTNILKNQGVNIWNDNTTREFLDNRGLYDYKEGDMGPMYGISLRSFGCKYEGCDKDYIGKGYDQLNELINSIKKDPYSRRHIMTMYNPSELKNSVLAPCHGISIQYYVSDNNLSCSVYNRSQDVFLGMPFNIASYAILTYIIAKKCNLNPYKLIINTGDTHIYFNHLEQINTQINRTPLPFPYLKVSDNIIDKNFENIILDDFDLVGYLYHPSIKASMAI